MKDFFGGRIGVAFCSPHRAIALPNGERIVDTITVDWHRKRNALAVGTNINTVEFFEDGKEIGEARTSAAYRCLAHNPRPEFLFFLDDDVLPHFDAFTKLFFRLKTMPEFDIAAGVYCCKWANPADPLIYAGNGMGAFWDWTMGDLLTTQEHGITATHMGLTLIRTSLFQRMLDAKVVNDEVPFFKTVRETFPDPAGAIRTRSGTEDMWFYSLAAKVDVKIVVDTSVLAGHIDKARGITFGLPEYTPPALRAKWHGGKDAKEADGQKLALDLGAGGTRRHWDGYRTYTTDIRADAKPDYVQDTRWLNLPDGHFDLVASSHHLEHIGRWEQERAWAEIFRVCKPGGTIEHIVPSIEWAAAKIADGCIDEHVLNVLYGAQEAHGYERQFNLHYFGYTKAVAAALAQQAGFTDIVCQDWRDRPELGYNLVIRGNKPAAPDAETKEPATEPATDVQANGAVHNDEVLAGVM